MVMFERKKGELPPFRYNIGDKIMGYHSSIGGQMLVGGEIIERTQSTSYLDDNEYKIKLELELCEGCEAGKDLTWWISEREAKPFKQEAWKKAAEHWLEHGRLQTKAYLQFIRMHRSLREESDDITDERLQKELDERHNAKKDDKEIEI